MQNITPETAKRDDWRTQPMPLESQLLRVDAVFTLDEFRHISNGFIPESSDDKWFIFYEAPFLYLHRSWTGFCIFAVRFEPLPEGMRMAEVIVNRNLNQYFEKYDSGSIGVLKRLLSGISKPDVARQKRKLASEKAEAEAIVLVAEKMLSGEMSIIEGSRKLVSLGRNGKRHKEDKFQIFRGIDSESDVLPTADSRKYWNPEVLKRKDKEAADYEAIVKEAALQACRELVSTYKTVEARSNLTDDFGV